MLDRVECIIEKDPLDGRSIKITPVYAQSPLIMDEDLVKLGFEDNSVYEFKIPGVRAVDGPAKDIHVKYITKPAPCYISLREVTSLAHGLSLDDESVLYHIREASKYADYLIDRYNRKAHPGEQIILEEMNLEKENFEIYMFIKYKALRDCLLDFYIQEAAKPNTIKNQTGDLIYEHNFDLKRIKDLLDDIEDEYEKWEEEIVTITAAPTSSIRGQYAHHKVYPNRLNTSGYGRDRYPVGIDTGYRHGHSCYGRR